MTNTTVPAESGAFSFDLPAPDSFSFDAPVPFEHLESERRERRREVLQVQARICVEGDSQLDVHTVDLSSHGLAITSKRPLNVNQECRVELGISAPELASPPALRASVRYCARLREDQFRIGMKFSAVSIEAAELLVAALGL